MSWIKSAGGSGFCANWLQASSGFSGMRRVMGMSQYESTDTANRHYLRRAAVQRLMQALEAHLPVYASPFGKPVVSRG